MNGIDLTQTLVPVVQISSLKEYCLHLSEPLKGKSSVLITYLE